MKKITLVFSVMMIAVFILAACGGGAAQPAAEKPEKLSVWITWGDNPAQIQELFNKFGDANGIKVEVTAPIEEDKILTALNSSNPPDVLVLSGGDLVKSYASQGFVEPLNDLITSANIDMGDFYEAPLKACQYNDQYLCLPWGNDIYALFWNKDLFKEAGLDPEKPPRTLDELVEMSKLLTKVDADGKITQAGFIPDFSWGHNDLYAQRFGGFWYNPEGTVLTINSDAMVNSYKWQQQFYCDGVTPQQMLDFAASFGDYNSSEQAFYAGKTAFQVDGEWQVGPNFIPQFAPGLNYGITAFPVDPNNADKEGSGVVQGTVALIPAKATNKEWSSKLLAWMLSPEIVAEEMSYNANLPTSKKAAQDPRFKEIEGFDKFIEIMGNPASTYVITSPISLEINDALVVAEEKILRECADPKPLLDEIQAEYEQLLKESLAQ
ncbi:MAG: extracellular solute-binding protein [Anaerolineaceae bacterium]|nr:extracellular solute-binding protein [Anaerolineaceae bacterium]